MDKQPTTESYITLKEVSEITGYATSTLYGFIRGREIPYYKPRQKLLFLKSEIERWMKGEPANNEQNQAA